MKPHIGCHYSPTRTSFNCEVPSWKWSDHQEDAFILPTANDVDLEELFFGSRLLPSDAGLMETAMPFPDSQGGFWSLEEEDAGAGSNFIPPLTPTPCRAISLEEEEEEEEEDDIGASSQILKFYGGGSTTVADEENEDSTIFCGNSSTSGESENHMRRRRRSSSIEKNGNGWNHIQIEAVSDSAKQQKKPKLEKHRNSSVDSLRGEQHAGGRERDQVRSMTPAKEMMYRAAVLRPVFLWEEPQAATAAERPRRKNVKISCDPQTVAARHRRERISEKLRVLQRMVPGGNKMDTASMLDEAASYLKFLKSQIRALENFREGLHCSSSGSCSSASSFPFNNYQSSFYF